ncbi:hypothetical protein EEL52_02710 [Muribaculaceae bacterium Isolate-113 (HZI)]|nr:hypothetical protein EEL53_04460 [Muribaculaceae bacterium Isolate-114 (HZI)]ROT24814.1 hypothetical protein EEL52_02710 [Muribaculaceae bacterium Isolate-113 (HZI)]
MTIMIPKRKSRRRGTREPKARKPRAEGEESQSRRRKNPRAEGVESQSRRRKNPRPKVRNPRPKAKESQSRRRGTPDRRRGSREPKARNTRAEGEGERTREPDLLKLMPMIFSQEQAANQLPDKNNQPDKKQRPAYYKEHRPHNCRRATFHDYRRPGKYMINLTKDPAAPAYSRLAGDPTDPQNPARTLLSPAGEIINRMITDLNTYPDFEIENHVIMPDHVHILWRVKYDLPKDFGYYVGLFKSRCTKIWRETFPEIPNVRSTSLFAPKFNDRIAFSEEMAIRMNNYISDNPRRRLLAIRHPNLFNKAQRVRILDIELDVFGNFHLLKHPQIAAAVVSSRYTPEQRASYERAWEETIRGQGVLVSPFISKPEQELMHRVIEEGGSVIRLIPDGIPPRYKPSGKEFTLCAEGRCLHIGMPRQSMHKEELRRNKCLLLNNLARWIASHPSESLTLISTGSRNR